MIEDFRTYLKWNLDVAILRATWKKIPNDSDVGFSPIASLFPEPVHS